MRDNSDSIVNDLLREKEELEREIISIKIGIAEKKAKLNGIKGAIKWLSGKSVSRRNVSQ